MSERGHHGWPGFWLRRFFWLTSRAPRVMAAARPVVCAGVLAFCGSVRRGMQANARRLLGAGASAGECRRLARRTLGNFYLFCCDVGRSRGSSMEDMLSRVESIEGMEFYRAARARGRGAIVVTAHMGSFEVALAALRAREPHVHVLFRRDANDEFERQRSELRRRLGVHEVAVDQGWTMWIALREALRSDEVVIIQGDRVLPGQKGQKMAMFGGEMEIPGSPVKLALASDAPIIPIFSVRTPGGKIRVMIGEAIEVGGEDGEAGGCPHAAMLKLAGVIEKQILAYPEQWLMLDAIQR